MSQFALAGYKFAMVSKKYLYEHCFSMTIVSLMVFAAWAFWSTVFPYSKMYTAICLLFLWFLSVGVALLKPFVENKNIPDNLRELYMIAGVQSSFIPFIGMFSWWISIG
jgi:ABC-type Mn2+/Zn2+ transport system permease subunit